MAKGDWWFKFEWNDWLADEALNICSFETQGFWLRCICVMRRSGVAELTGSVDDLRRLLGCLPEEVMRCSGELKRTKAADVIIGNGTVSILSRRLKRELDAKEYNRLQVAKSRSKSNVSPESQDRVKSKSNKKENHQEGGEPSAEDFGKPSRSFTNPSAQKELDCWLDAVASVMGAKNRGTLADLAKWEKVCIQAITENRDLTDFLAAIKKELARLEGQLQYFSPASVLKQIQLGAVTQSAPKFALDLSGLVQ